MTVAVKKLNKMDETEMEKLITEVVILSQINHRNVVKLLGCCLEKEVPLLVYEFVSNGTLSQLIHNPDEDFVLSWSVCLTTAAGAARAIACLHSYSSIPIYHKDIKSSNILLDGRFKAKVSDLIWMLQEFMFVDIREFVDLDISSNNLKGRIPEHVGSMVLSSVIDLNMSSNSFQGNIPDSIANMTNLLVLDLSCNNFSGEVPIPLFSQLSFLSLSKNQLEGDMIPSYIMNLSSELWHLYLDNNNFGGTIKGSSSIFAMLSTLDVSNNKATDELPNWIGDLKDLSSLSLARNEFYGDIPSQLCKLTDLQFLDLSDNMFTGRIPSCVDKHLPLIHLNLHGNGLTGVISHGLARLSFLVTLDLRNNQLSGGIPQWIDNLSNLVILLLGGNQLEGDLPIQLCRLQHVNIIDLSNNSLSGFIPPCFQNMSFGTLKVEVSYFDWESSKSTREFKPWKNSANLYLPEYACSDGGRKTRGDLDPTQAIFF